MEMSELQVQSDLWPRFRADVRRSFRQPAVKPVFSRQFHADLLREEAKYREISDRLASVFRERVAGQTREIICWQGGDHIGPHGFPCRRTKPFPFFIYYQAFECCLA